MKIIVDSDALIALFNKDDAHADKAQTLFETLYLKKARLIYPATMLVETIDTLQRKLKKNEEASQIAHLIAGAEFAQESIEPINGVLLKEAVEVFRQSKTQSNTLADAIVATVARKYSADAIFSFDLWYKKQGFSLISDMFGDFDINQAEQEDLKNIGNIHQDLKAARKKMLSKAKLK